MICPDFKKNVMLGGLYGASIGASSGSMAGYVGLMQACHVNGIDKAACDYLKDHMGERAIATGSAVGGSMGFVLGAVAYTAYKSFMGWCYPAQRQQQQQQARAQSQAVQLVAPTEPRSDEDPRVSISVKP